ncbi:MAG: hypothetical protein KC420_02610, partial [Myxococcales bacterium]|nr:hypothetical protein [Myxococcales bacterium]
MAESVTSSRARAPSPTRETWFIDQVLKELAAHRAGGLNLLCERLPAEGGEFHYAGLLGDEERCAITHVRDIDEAVTPIAAGDFHRAISVYARRAKSWDPETSPPPSVIVDGARRH